MPYEEEKMHSLEEDLEKVRNELQESLTEISKETEDSNQLKEEMEEIVEELHDELADLEDEKENLLEMGVDSKEVEAYFDSRRNEILAGTKPKIEKHMTKISEKVKIFREKAIKKMVEYDSEKVSDSEQLDKKNKGD